jgi:hypothetical protein
MLTNLGTYLVLKRIWNPIDFQGHGHDQELHTKLLLGSLLPYLGKRYSKIKDLMEPENVPFIHRLKYMHYSLMGKMKAALYRQ